MALLTTRHYAFHHHPSSGPRQRSAVCIAVAGLLVAISSLLLTRSADAQALALQGGDSVAVSGNGTSGIYQSKPISNATTSYSYDGHPEAVTIASNSLFSLGDGAAITNTDNSYYGGANVLYTQAGSTATITGGTISGSNAGVGINSNGRVLFTGGHNLIGNALIDIELVRVGRRNIRRRDVGRRSLIHGLPCGFGVQQKRCYPLPVGETGGSKDQGRKARRGITHPKGRQSCKQSRSCRLVEAKTMRGERWGDRAGGPKAAPWITRGVSPLATKEESNGNREWKEKGGDKTARLVVAHTGSARFPYCRALRLLGRNLGVGRNLGERRLKIRAGRCCPLGR